MIIGKYISGIIIRDLKVIQSEIDAYPDEKSLWETRPGITNSAGTLVMHIAGNLQHFVGTVLGDTGYERDREAEFSRRNVPRAELHGMIEATIAAIAGTLLDLPDSALTEIYPVEVSGVSFDTGDFLIHLTGHLAYHAGQINYHRRIVTAQKGNVTALRMPALSSARKV